MVTLESLAPKECDPREHTGNATNPVAITGLKIEEAAGLFRALGDAARLRLAAHLLPGGRCVGDLAELEGEALSTISQRLRILHTEKVVIRRRIGKHVQYRLADAHIADLVQNALAHASE
jgi:ArsR family transcriptional regulator